MHKFFPEDTGWVTQDDDEEIRDTGYEQSLTPFQRGYSRGYEAGATDARKKLTELRRLNSIADADRRKARRYINLGVLLAGVIAYPVAFSVAYFTNVQAFVIIWLGGTVLGIPLAMKGNSIQRKSTPNYFDRQDLEGFYKEHGVVWYPD